MESISGIEGTRSNHGIDIQKSSINSGTVFTFNLINAVDLMTTSCTQIVYICMCYVIELYIKKLDTSTYQHQFFSRAHDY